MRFAHRKTLNACTARDPSSAWASLWLERVAVFTNRLRAMRSCAVSGQNGVQYWLVVGRCWVLLDNKVVAEQNSRFRSALSASCTAYCLVHNADTDNVLSCPCRRCEISASRLPEASIMGGRLSPAPPKFYEGGPKHLMGPSWRNCRQMCCLWLKLRK